MRFNADWAQLGSVWRPLLLVAGLLCHSLLRGAVEAAQLLQASTEPVDDYGGFYMMHGKGLHLNQTYSQMDVSKRCQCHRHCFTVPSCKAFSVQRLNAELLRCFLADEDVFVNTPTDMTGHSYAVRKDLVWMLGSDNLAYKRLKTNTAGFNATKATCEAIPGYRMVAPRFQAQMPLLMELCLGRTITPTDNCGSYNDWFFVDLVKAANGELMVRSEIPVSETDLANVVADKKSDSVFIYAHSHSLHDDAATRNFRPVCQANIFNVNW